MPDPIRNHTVRVLVDGRQIVGWTEYEIKSSLLEPSDSFSLSIPFSREAWDILRPDRPVKILIDDVAQVTGFLDERSISDDQDVITVAGRDRIGRLIQESSPGCDYTGLMFDALIAKLASPWFSTVTLSNVRNRKLLRGRGKKSKSAEGALEVFGNLKRFGTRIAAGQMRWAVIEDLCKQAGCLAFSSGDGNELIVAKPNYTQEIQHRFFRAAANSRRTRETNVLGVSRKDSTGDRYSRIIVVGSGKGTDANYGAVVTRRSGEVKNNPLTVDGDGLDFSAPKRLVIADTGVSSQAEAQELAAREMSRRDGQGQAISIRAASHGQVVAGQYPTLFAPDTLAHVEDEVTGTVGVYLITTCSHQSDRRTGERTALELVPKGTELSL